jgi:dCTP diphosphatase
MPSHQEIVERLRAFRSARDWEKFHKPKDLAISISLEAAELLEHFQWKSDEEVQAHIKRHREAISDEMADVASYLFLLANDLGVDLHAAMEAKIRKNEERYPVETARGSARKYTEYQ